MAGRRPRTRRGLAGAIGLGLAGGMRTAIPAATIALRDGRPRSRMLRLVIVLGSAGELVADKVPGIPSRTEPLGLAARFASSGAVGRNCAGPLGGLFAGATAIGTAFVTHNARRDLARTTGLPDPVIAVAEDTLAIGIACLVTRRPLDPANPSSSSSSSSSAAAAKPASDPGPEPRRRRRTTTEPEPVNCRRAKRRRAARPARSGTGTTAAEPVTVARPARSAGGAKVAETAKNAENAETAETAKTAKTPETAKGAKRGEAVLPKPTKGRKAARQAAQAARAATAAVARAARTQASGSTRRSASRHRRPGCRPCRRSRR